jgi:hypothetical protein
MLIGVAAYNPRDGAIAQMAERLICIQEVAGSIPAGSTSLLGSRLKSGSV